MDRITIIAEMSSNHNGDINRMKQMIKTAKECGADVAKFQLYDTDKLIRDHKYYDTLKRGQLSHRDWKVIVETCNHENIEFLASVFDAERIKWCEDVGMKRYKISSFDIYNEPLIQAIVDTGKPIIMSLGLMDSRGKPSIPGRKVDYLYCVSNYPTELSDLDFSRVNFNEYSGFSDHTIGIKASVMAMARGARIIEKHFTIDKSLDGWDHQLSMDSDDLDTLVRYAIAFEQIKK
jgi:sialic acid synthase SpsE